MGIWGRKRLQVKGRHRLRQANEEVEFGRDPLYAQQTRYLLAFEALAGRRLDEIDEGLIEVFCQARRRHVSTATTNRAMAVLRRMLRLAHEWANH